MANTVRDLLRRWSGRLDERSEKRFYLEVEGALSGLRERGYAVVDRHFSAQSFGNGWVTYRRGHVTLRVLRDRGHYSVDVLSSSAEGDTIPYWLLRRLLGRSAALQGLGAGGRGLAGQLLEDLDDIEALTSAERMEETRAATKADYAEWFEEQFGAGREGGGPDPAKGGRP